MHRPYSRYIIGGPQDKLLERTDVKWLTDSTHFIKEGIRNIRYAIVCLPQVTEAQTLSSGASVPIAGLTTLTRALQLGKGPRINICTGYKYALFMLHAHAAIWRERTLLAVKNSPIKPKKKTLVLLQAGLKLWKWLSVYASEENKRKTVMSAKETCERKGSKNGAASQDILEIDLILRLWRQEKSLAVLCFR